MRWLRALHARLFPNAVKVWAAQEEARVLLDQMRQIEWRLAMCRSCAVDVNIAHSIAFKALDRHGVEPAMSSASRYQIEKNQK